jgi:FKBP-type peptidyl-prolyl cis-trans isomerase FkpA
MNHTRVRLGLALPLITLMLACGGDDDPLAPQPEVIEDITFDSSLEIDLAAMTKLDSGVYIEDLVEGTGEAVVAGSTIQITYTLWLSDGTQIQTGPLNLVVDAGNAIPGFLDGLLGMRVGGTRKILVPPALGYGNQDYLDIPGGSVLVFEVVLNDLS